MGLYLYGPEAAFANATSQLCKALDGMVAASSIHAEKLLFVSSQSRKFLCKHHAAGTPSSATLPVCEFKLAPSLSGFSIIACRYTSQLHACYVVLPVQHRGCHLLDNRYKTSAVLLHDHQNVATCVQGVLMQTQIFINLSRHTMDCTRLMAPFFLQPTNLSTCYHSSSIALIGN